MTVLALKPKKQTPEAEMAIIQLGVLIDKLERLPRDEISGVKLCDENGQPMTGQMCLCAMVLRLSQVLTDIDHKRHRGWFGI